MQALHRVRVQFVHQRTAIVSQFRCFLLEYGIAIHTGIGMFRRDATRILVDDSNDLTPTMLDSGRYATLDDDMGFSLVPWRPVIEQRLRQQLAATVCGGEVSWEFGRARGPSVH
ncbi:type VI secretion protein [Pandoraea horticolens]|uniref:Type VI secretion protein n=1 Tax=Pandoraea horticolens TaxID=2508298 RepID=A0A5E4WI40_9BURK|nr:type VI secretion protein [Pandoraea horticolens]